MYKTVTITVILVALATAVNTQDQGSPSPIIGFPHFVSIRTSVVYEPHYCTGTILNSRWILTAAVCIPFSLEDIYLLLGIGRRAHLGVKYQIEHTVVHPNFDENWMKNNIALIRTVKPIQFNDRVQPLGVGSVFVQQDQEAMVVGWARVSQLNINKSLAVMRLNLKFSCCISF